MNTTQTQIFKETFIKVFPMAQQITGLFFANLLAQDATIEPIALPYLHQTDSLQKALTTAKVAVDNLAIVQPALEKIGRDWALQGLDDTHYDIAYIALEETLVHSLGSVRDEEKTAWKAAYDKITAVMQQAGAKERGLITETTPTVERSFPLPEVEVAIESTTFELNEAIVSEASEEYVGDATPPSQVEVLPIAEDKAVG